MNYNEALNYIHSFDRFGIKPGLERISALCRAFGGPQNSLKFVHIAGTNGKGSTATMIARIFSTAGYRTGLFISPYVIDFCERIQINNCLIPEEELAEIITQIKPVADEMIVNAMQPTEFEIITASAFIYFARNSCDIVVLEVGLGGRLDSTNIIKTPLASVITSISLDHTGILGSTIAEISSEKCGIIKQDGLTVSYPLQHDDAARIIDETAHRMNNRLFVPDPRDVSIDGEGIGGTAVHFGQLKVYVPFMGRHMVYNAFTAASAAAAISDDESNDITITLQNIADGIASATMPARMEIISDDPFVIIDGGHNEGCAAALKNVINGLLAGSKITAICGMMADKDYRTYLSEVAPLLDKIITVTPSNPRALSSEELACAASEYCNNCIAASSIAEAVHKAFSLPADLLLICGSFYLVSEIKPMLVYYI